MFYGPSFTFSGKRRVATVGVSVCLGLEFILLINSEIILTRSSPVNVISEMATPVEKLRGACLKRGVCGIKTLGKLVMS